MPRPAFWPACALPAALTVLALAGSLSAATSLENNSNPSPGAASTYASLLVDPPSIELLNRFAYSQLLITGKRSSGEAVDLTRTATITQQGDLVEVSKTGFVRPKHDGSGLLTIAVAGKTLTVPLSVRGMSAEYHPSFVRDVNPALGKIGCNAGTCHGSKNGKNGFKLSLRGYDPLYDHRALTDDVFARRFNRAAPEQSLMLLKPTGTVPHQGGAVIHPGERYYELLRGWIADGAKLDLDSPRVAKIEISPQGVTIPLAQMTQQMKVIATYTDGSKRDVTAEAIIQPSDIDVLSVDKQGLVTAIRRGEAAALARYEGAYAATPIFVMGDRSGYAWRETPVWNYIDELVYQKQRKVKVLPSGVCTDAEFVRRVYLDLTGLPPTPDELGRFVADSRPMRQKRDALIDRLIGSPAFVDFWTNKWSDLLQVNAKFLGENGAAALRQWIRQSVESDKPYDKFAYQVLTASGSTMANPPAAYYKRLRTPGELMENTTQLFLSTRFNCNKCHDHPFERWTQDQYYYLAAYFAEVSRDRDPKYKGEIGGSAVDEKVPLVEIIGDNGKGVVKHERTGQVVSPKFPFEYPDMPAKSGTHREQLARWITSEHNPYFARSFVNRIWSYLTGVGFIEPVDDIRAGNPPTNPELLTRLTRQFVDERFDVRKLMATICKSRTYQLSVATERWNDGDTVNYSHALARRLPAEVLYDAVHRVTGSTSHLPGLPSGSRAADIIDPTKKLPDAFLDLFGAAPRESACECERSTGMMLGPVMNLIMGPTINDAIADPDNDISKLVAREKSDAKVVEGLFLAILNRPATPQEIAEGVKLLQSRLEGSQLEKVRREFAAYEQDLDHRQAEWETTAGKVKWQVLKPAQFTSSGGSKLELLPDNSILATGKHAKDLYSVEIDSDLKGITGLRLECLADKRLPRGGPGRGPDGNFVLSRFSVLDSTGNPLELQHSQADFTQEAFSAAHVIDSQPDLGWAIFPQTKKNHVLVVETRHDLGGMGTTMLFVRLIQHYSDPRYQIGRFRISITNSPRPLTIDSLPPMMVRILAIAPLKRTADERAAIAQYYRRDEHRFAELQKQLANLERNAANPRLVAAQDLAWALINSPAFIFNH